MKLIVISSSTSIVNEAEIVTQLFMLGLPCFHLRNHKLSTRSMKAFINQIPAEFHSRIVLHTHFNLARKLKLRGIHLSKSHKKKRFKTWFSLQLVKTFNRHSTVSTSYNSVAQLLEYNDTRHYNYDYVFLSPIFDTFSNKFQSGFTENILKAALQKAELKVIARGGIDDTTIEKALNIGFDGVALYSSIWKRKDPIVEFKKIIDKFKELNIPIE